MRPQNSVGITAVVQFDDYTIPRLSVNPWTDATSGGFAVDDERAGDAVDTIGQVKDFRALFTTTTQVNAPLQCLRVIVHAVTFGA
jgi:hypothetical protein